MSTCESRLEARLLVLLVDPQHEGGDPCYSFTLIRTQTPLPQGREVHPPRHLAHLLFHQRCQQNLES